MDGEGGALGATSAQLAGISSVTATAERETSSFTTAVDIFRTDFSILANELRWHSRSHRAFLPPPPTTRLVISVSRSHICSATLVDRSATERNRLSINWRTVAPFEGTQTPTFDNFNLRSFAFRHRGDPCGSKCSEGTTPPWLFTLPDSSLQETYAAEVGGRYPSSSNETARC